VSKKLSGQILHRRTGKLSSSVRALPTTLSGTSIIGGVQAGGGPSFYGAVHEFGGTRAYPIIAVKARALRFVMNGKTSFARSVMMPPAKIRAFAGPSLDENAEMMRAELQAALDKAIQE
jgi:phage gpG-like protein